MTVSANRLRMLAVLAMVGVPGLAHAQSLVGSAFGWLFRHDMSIVVVTDVTDEGKKLPQPSREHPVYFEAMIIGYHDWGKVIPGHRLPDKQTMIRMLFKVLAEQDYLPATADHKPTLLLAFGWGTLFPRLFQRPVVGMAFMGSEKLGRDWFSSPYEGNMIGPRVLYESAKPWEIDVIKSSAASGIFVASIQAFDVAQAQKGRAVLLWHTKISCPTPGVAMDTALPKMIRVAGPSIGRDMPRPVIATEPAHTGVVELGELKVLETIDTSKLPVADVSDQLSRAWDKNRRK